MKKRLHLLKLTCTPSLPSFLLIHPPTYTPTPSLFRNPNLSSTSVILRQVCSNYSRWDSNAENFRTQNFNSNSNSNSQDEDEDDDEDNYEKWSETEQWSEAAEKLIDDIWIFKVITYFFIYFPLLVLLFLSFLRIIWYANFLVICTWLQYLKEIWKDIKILRLTFESNIIDFYENLENKLRDMVVNFYFLFFFMEEFGGEKKNYTKKGRIPVKMSTRLRAYHRMR